MFFGNIWYKANFNGPSDNKADPAGQMWLCKRVQEAL